MKMIGSILYLLFPHKLMQFKWGRKMIGGKFYYMQTALPMYPYWSRVKFTSCQAVCLKEEYHD